jgi:hypothetical protein
VGAFLSLGIRSNGDFAAVAVMCRTGRVDPVILCQHDRAFGQPESPGKKATFLLLFKYPAVISSPQNGQIISHFSFISTQKTYL